MNCVETVGSPGTAYAESPLRILNKGSELVGWLGPAGLVIIQSHVSHSVPAVLQISSDQKQREREGGEREKRRKEGGRPKKPVTIYMLTDALCLK